jgi:hypothetical protein
MRRNRHLVKMSELLAEAQTVAASQKWALVAAALDEAQAALLHVGSRNDAEWQLVRFTPIPPQQKLKPKSKSRLRAR